MVGDAMAKREILTENLRGGRYLRCCDKLMLYSVMDFVAQFLKVII